MTLVYLYPAGLQDGSEGFRCPRATHVNIRTTPIAAACPIEDLDVGEELELQLQ
jgi:hypothetical protein